MPSDQPTEPDNRYQDVVYLSPADECANTATHGIGFLLSLAAILFFALTDQIPDAGLQIWCVVYAISMATVYACSTLSHVVMSAKHRHYLRAWDQGTIYLLIAGTYAPFIWMATNGPTRTAILVAVWGAAATGFYSKVLATHRINAISTITYLALGWLPAIPLVRTTPTICLAWMFIGGLAYSGGVLFLIRSHKVRYSHAGWHIMVMIGSACHCYAITRLFM